MLNIQQRTCMRIHSIFLSRMRHRTVMSSIYSAVTMIWRASPPRQWSQSLHTENAGHDLIRSEARLSSPLAINAKTSRVWVDIHLHQEWLSGQNTVWSRWSLEHIQFSQTCNVNWCLIACHMLHQCLSIFNEVYNSRERKRGPMSQFHFQHITLIVV